MTCQWLHVGTIRIHHIYTGLAISVGNECNFLAIGGPRGTPVVGRVVCKVYLRPPPRISNIYLLVPIPVRNERYPSFLVGKRLPGLPVTTGDVAVVKIELLITSLWTLVEVSGRAERAFGRSASAPDTVPMPSRG